MTLVYSFLPQNQPWRATLAWYGLLKNEGSLQKSSFVFSCSLVPRPYEERRGGLVHTVCACTGGPIKSTGCHHTRYHNPLWCHEAPAHVQAVCTRPSPFFIGTGNRASSLADKQGHITRLFGRGWMSLDGYFSSVHLPLSWEHPYGSVKSLYTSYSHTFSMVHMVDVWHHDDTCPTSSDRGHKVEDAVFLPSVLPSTPPSLLLNITHTLMLIITHTHTHSHTHSHTLTHIHTHTVVCLALFCLPRHTLHNNYRESHHLH